MSLLEALGLKPTGRQTADLAGGGAVERHASALTAWRAARAGVVASLKRLETAIRAMRDPEGDAAIVLVKAIQANLSESPSTTQAVAELDRYLRSDAIIAEAEEPNGFGIEISIRAPLLPALEVLKSALAAA